MINLYKKIHYPALIILITFFSQFYIAQELWITNERELPPIPLFDILPIQFGKTIDTLLIVLMFSSSFFLFYKPEQKKFLLLFFIPSLLLVLEDVMRLQPWFYLHTVMMGVIAFEKELTKEHVKRYLQWIVIAIYFWSGFNKFNIAFAWEVFPWFTEPLGIGKDYFVGMHNLNLFDMPDKNYHAYFIPTFEILVACLLFFPRLRILGIIGSLMIHTISLYAIGPYGHDWNQIVWPWNMEMPFLCCFLFLPIEKGILKEYFSQLRLSLQTKTGKLILFLFLIAPILSYFRFWDKGLSIHLYSGNADEMEFYFEGYEEKLVETSLGEHLYLDTNTMQSTMKVEYWVMDQTGVPMYAAPRKMKKIGKYLCDCLERPEKGGIKLLLRNGFSSIQDTIIIPCNDLQ